MITSYLMAGNGIPLRCRRKHNFPPKLRADHDNFPPEQTSADVGGSPFNIRRSFFKLETHLSQRIFTGTAKIFWRASLNDELLVEESLEMGLDWLHLDEDLSIRGLLRDHTSF